ncbi:MAG: hypothetical protein AAF171_25390 [Cyanobacteria bacterium P01_A01_bin.116]
MKQSPGYILVIGKPLTAQTTGQTSGHNIGPPNAQTSPAVPAAIVTASPEQAVAQAKEAHPYLVILSGDARQSWSPQIARQIRRSLAPEGVVIVALNESSELSWKAEEDNTAIDGFFVQPLGADILSALHTSAVAKQRYLATAL